MNYCVTKDVPLTGQKIVQIVRSFEANELPQLRKWEEYYAGKMAILRKTYADPTKKVNRIVKNFCKSITQNYAGYICGIPVSYSSSDDITKLNDIMLYNDEAEENTDYLTSALIHGIAYQMCYIDSEGEIRFKMCDPCQCIPVYDNTLDHELLYVIRYYIDPEFDFLLGKQNDNNYIIELYTPQEVVKYKSFGLGETTEIERAPHYFNDVPFTVFELNKEQESIFNQIMSLNDGYNELISTSLDEIDAVADSYLVFKGTGIDAEDAEMMREKRILMIDAEDDTFFLTKQINDTHTQNTLDDIEQSIRSIANCPDFSDTAFSSNSGIAIRYKLIGFDNVASSIKTRMKKALLRRIELIYNVLGLTDNMIITNINIIFTSNLPVDYTENVNLINGLRGVVSTRTLISLLPFVEDVDAEMEALREEQEEQMNLYGVGFDTKETDDEVLAGETT